MLPSRRRSLAVKLLIAVPIVWLLALFFFAREGEHSVPPNSVSTVDGIR